MASDNERAARIITHINNDHTRELSHYLRHYAGVSASASRRSPTLREVNLQTMLVSAAGADYRINFEPPAASWADVKDRFISMDVAARAALGISDVNITRYAAPRGFDWVVFGGVLLYFSCAATLPLVRPGSPAWDAMDGLFPGAAAWYCWLVRAIFLPVLGIHVGEMIAFDRMRMNKYGVPRWSAVWWMWELSVFLEGVTAWWRIERVAEEKRDKAKKSR